MLFTNHSLEWRWQNSGWGFCQNSSDNIWQWIPLPLPLLYLSSPSSCLMMLLCVCLWVCILCVKECVFLRSLCQCVFSSNTGFSPYYAPPPPPFSLFTFDGYTSTSSKFYAKPNLFGFHYFSILAFSWTPPVLFLTNSSPLSFICPFINPSFIDSSHLVSSSQLPSSTLLYFSFTSHLCTLALPPSPCPLRSPPPFFPSSLSFTQCSVPRSLWLGCSSVAESLCALRCLQSIPSTRAHNQVLPLLS